MNAVRIEDVSAVLRAGVKGPASAAWLARLGLPVPSVANTWLPLPDGLIARLGISEFLVEGPQAQLLTEPRTHGVYPVLRQDLALMLRGQRLPELLLETCAVNFQLLDRKANPVVLTSMAGVAVIAVPLEIDGHAALRLWCDISYGAWLSDTLGRVARELPSE